jgi:hypothetical protein
MKSDRESLYQPCSDRDCRDQKVWHLYRPDGFGVACAKHRSPEYRKAAQKKAARMGHRI